MPIRKPTDAELAILRVLWNRGPSTVRQVAAAMDRELDSNAYIRPGLGDAGDRVFGTA